MASIEAFEFTDSPTIKITVGSGENQKSHFIHSSLLKARSGYFRGALPEGQGIQELTVSHLDASAFQLFIKWLYSGDVAPFPFPKYEEEQTIMDALINTYILADKLKCPGLKNRTIDLVQDLNMYCEVQLAELNSLINAELGDSKLMKYLIKEVAWTMLKLGTVWATRTEQWELFVISDPGLVTDLMNQLDDFHRDRRMTKKMPGDPAFEEGCQWHEHSAIPNNDCNRWQQTELTNLQAFYTMD